VGPRYNIVYEYVVDWYITGGSGNKLRAAAAAAAAVPAFAALAAAVTQPTPTAPAHSLAASARAVPTLPAVAAAWVRATSPKPAASGEARRYSFNEGSPYFSTAGFKKGSFVFKKGFLSPKRWT
jgi:hypothetical protein